MFTIAQITLQTFGIALAALASAYALLACFAESLAAKRAQLLRAHDYVQGADAKAFVPPECCSPVTVLKPLCGSEPNLYHCLRTFCVQDHPHYQIVFGVQDPADVALATVRRLQAELPAQDIVVVIDSRLHGSNGKVSNLANMLPAARHPILVAADSDVIVDPDYLRRVTAPLTDPAIGLVTSLYRARAIGGVWSHLVALFINEWFMPAVRVARLFGSSTFTSGVTIALRRQTLAGLGGFEAIADVLADDYWLGEHTRRLGLKTVAVDRTVDTVVAEPSFSSACRHELRWLRTIRSVQPRSYGPLGITFTVPVAALGTLLAGASSIVLGLAATAVVARVLLHRLARPACAPPWLVPVGDLLTFALWCWSFASRRVRWRAGVFDVERDGSMQRTGERATAETQP
ncbi:bacteriohopanetetrol glucosamine biosynthesis glycosyltransferase HpnI [Steroidobacter cummioxidans]|uniref:bacteriohopanetetrol glucosamine biosynthesis glycosyltransferase HpnI n=1 Tax=Steroidobacter cummioxidans TaxID=1803913 RepID=UPI00137B48EB|nr:bacteriohopanetetrol glucosamine biosynthesis glycosyltransferase HpnI [Steroidobacter cummioxidans]